MFVFLNVALKHLPRVKFGFLNMETFLAVANIAADILRSVIPYSAEFMFKTLLSHVCFFSMLHLNI